MMINNDQSSEETWCLLSSVLLGVQTPGSDPASRLTPFDQQHA